MENLIRHLRDTQALAKLIGEAPAFLKVVQALPAVAKNEATVLITGETGTGKELVARAIHYLSKRAAFPFVPVNCGLLPDTLLEAELFGHERGAFTDAYSRRLGLVVQAEKGTLFLDEVDTLTARAQVALLRLLQDKRFRALGASGEQEANVRVVAATNALLDQLVRNGTFRADLYYRLCVFTLHLPPLRKRKEDIVALASHFVKKHAPTDRAMLQLVPAARAALMSWDWPGNVREIENTIIRGIQFSRTEWIEVKDLGLPSGGEQGPNVAVSTAAASELSFKVQKQKVIEAFERDYLTRLLSAHRGNVSQAARTAGKERRDLGKLLKKDRLNPKHFSTTTNPGTVSG